MLGALAERLRHRAHHPDTPASFDEQVSALMKRCSSKYS